MRQRLELEMCPDPTQAFSWPLLKKRLTLLWPRYFLTLSDKIFWPEWNKIEKIGILWGNFPDSEMADPTQPKHKKNPTWTGSKTFDPDPSLIRTFTWKAYKNLDIIDWNVINSFFSKRYLGIRVFKGNYFQSFNRRIKLIIFVQYKMHNEQTPF